MDETLKNQIEEYLRTRETVRQILSLTRDILLKHHGFTTYRTSEICHDLVVVTLDGTEYSYSADAEEVYYADGSAVPRDAPAVAFFQNYLPLVEWGFAQIDGTADRLGWTKIGEDEDSITYQAGQVWVTIPVWSTIAQQVTVRDCDVEVRHD